MSENVNPNKFLTYDGLIEYTNELKSRIITLSDTDSAGASIGKNNYVGRKGFYYSHIDTKNRMIYLATSLDKIPSMGESEGEVDPDVGLSNFLEVLEETGEYTEDGDPKYKVIQEGYAVGDKFSLVNNEKYEACFTIKEFDTGKNAIIYEEVKLFDEIKEVPEGEREDDDYSFSVPSKPQIGKCSLKVRGFSAGVSNNSSGNESVALGRRTRAYGDYSLTAGRDNSAGHASAAFGVNNNVLADYAFAIGGDNLIDHNGDKSIVGGDNNYINGNSNLVVGEDNTIAERDDDLNDNVTPDGGVFGNKNIIGGSYNKITKDENIVGGQHNKITSDRNVIGGTYNKVSTQRNLVVGNNNEIKDALESNNGANLVGGNGNIISGAYQTVNGKVNAVSGSENIVGGDNNNVSKSASGVFGQYNTDSGGYNIIAGKNQNASADLNAVFGQGNIISGPLNVVGGRYNQVNMRNNLVAGINNVVTGTNSDAAGANLVGGHTNQVSGTDNLIGGSSNGAAGNKNLVVGENNYTSSATAPKDGNKNIIGGANNKVTADECLVVGGNHEVTKARSIIGGQYSDLTGEPLFAIGSGSNNSGNIIRSNAIAVFENGNTIIAGDLTVQGATTVKYLETITTDQNTILLRSNAKEGEGLNGQYSGIIANKYDGTNNGYLVFDSSGTAWVGDEGELQPLATRQLETNNIIPRWDENEKTLKNSNIYADSDNNRVVIGANHLKTDSKDFVVNSLAESIQNSTDAFIIGGYQNVITNSNNTIIINGGNRSLINTSPQSVIVTGNSGNSITGGLGQMIFGSGNIINTEKNDGNTRGCFNYIVGGDGCTISGTAHQCVVGGKKNIATGYRTTIFGFDNKDNAKQHTTIFGVGNIANADYQTLMGKYSDPTTNTLFIIGNGGELLNKTSFDAITDQQTKSQYREEKQTNGEIKYRKYYSAFEIKLDNTGYINNSLIITDATLGAKISEKGYSIKNTDSNFIVENGTLKPSAQMQNILDKLDAETVNRLVAIEQTGFTEDEIIKIRRLLATIEGE